MGLGRKARLKRVLLFVTLPLAVVAIAVFAYVDAYRVLPPNVTYQGGNEFGVEGQLVDAVVDPFPRSVSINNSLIITLRLKPAMPGASPPPALPPGVANETNGTLTPTLSGPDCTVTPQDGASQAMSTAQTSLDAFVWTWSIDRCETSGDKAVLLSLKYAGDGPTSDPNPLEVVAHIDVTEGPSLDAASRIVAIVTGLLAALAPFVQMLINSKSAKSSADPSPRS
jgi:hypothetical protein